MKIEVNSIKNLYGTIFHIKKLILQKKNVMA